MAITNGGLLNDPDSLSYDLPRAATAAATGTGTITFTVASSTGYTAGDILVADGFLPDIFEGLWTVASVAGTTIIVTAAGMVTGTSSTQQGILYHNRELVVDYINQKVLLSRTGNLTADGVTLKCLYSKLKELWKNDATLIKFPFAMTPITDEQFEFQNGWDIYKQYSPATEIKFLTAQGDVYTVTNAVYGTGAITFTCGTNGLIAGDLVTVAGVVSTGGTGFNDAFTVASTSGTGFTTTPVTNPTSTYTSGGAVHTNFLHTTGDFLAAGIIDGMYIASSDGTTLYVGTGGNSGQEGLQVINATSTRLVLENLDGRAAGAAVNTNFTGGVTVEFWSENDYPWNLVRTGGWALKDLVGATIEQWANIISLGNLGAQKTTITLTGGVTTNASTAVTVTSTAGIINGNPIEGPYIRHGTTITVVNGTTLTLSLAATGSTTGAIFTVRPSDKLYHQIGLAVRSAVVSTATWATGIATFTTTTPHNIWSGETIVVAGVTPAGYNGTFVVIGVPSLTTFTVAIATNPTAYSTGGGITTAPAVTENFALSGPVNQAVNTYILNGLLNIVSAASWAGNVSTLTSVAHGLSAGQTVAITGVVPSGYNGTYIVQTVTSADVFTVTQLVNPGVFSSGTLSEVDWVEDYTGANAVLKIYAREQGYTYQVTAKEDIGNATISYQAYRFPVTNTLDLAITHTDAQISTNGVIADHAPYSTMNITWYSTPVSRTIGGTSYNFSVLIDADTGVAPGTFGSSTAEQIYEFVQWSLRNSNDVDAGTGLQYGSSTRDLLKFVGSTLYTLYSAQDGGVYIDNFAAADVNRVIFADNTGANRIFPYTAAGALAFNAYLVADGAANSKYAMFFTQLSGGRKFSTAGATIVKKSDDITDVTGGVGAATVNFDFDYDGNTQATWTPATAYVVGDEYRNGTTWYDVLTGYTSVGTFGTTDTTNIQIIPGPNVQVVAIGLTNAQYVTASGTIARSTTNNFTLTSALERNYNNPV